MGVPGHFRRVRGSATKLSTWCSYARPVAASTGTLSGKLQLDTTQRKRIEAIGHRRLRQLLEFRLVPKNIAVEQGTTPRA